MAVAQNQCPHCRQPVRAGEHRCPHCGVYLQLPNQEQAQSEAAHSSILGVAQPAPPASPLPQSVLEKALPDAVKQLDTTATTNITISGVLIAFYAGAIFAGKVQANAAFNAFIYALPIVLLLVTIILSARVFYPAGYLIDDYATLLRKKEERLRYSTLLLEVSVALLALAVFIYLMRPA